MFRFWRPALRLGFVLSALFSCVASHADITLDTSYGTAGTASVPLHSGTDDEFLSAVAIDADGKAVLVGDVYFWTGGPGYGFSRLGMVRLNPDGTPDPTFSGNGILEFDTCTASSIFIFSGTLGSSVAIQGDGKILAAGECIGDGPPANRAVVVRLLSDGTFDASFGTGGIAYLPGAAGSGGTKANAIAIQSDGRIVVAGQTGLNAYAPVATVMRLLPDGTVDTSFDPGSFGSLGTVSNFSAIAVMPDDRIVVGGSTNVAIGSSTDTNFYVVRLLANGTPDTAFAGSGHANFDVGTLTAIPDLPALTQEYTNGIALRQDGSVLLAGTLDVGGSANRYSLLAQLTPSGSLDANFGEGGYLALTAGAENNQALAVVLRPAGDAVVVGDMNPTQVSLTGVVVNSYPPSVQMRAAAMQADGNIIVAVRSLDIFATMRLSVTGLSEPDSRPDAFSLNSLANVVPGTLQTSLPVTITGLTAPANVSVTGGEFSIGCTDTWVPAGQIRPIVDGNSVCVRHVSAATNLTMLTTTLTIGGVSSSFSSTTGDVTPDAFSFPAMTNVTLSTTVTSSQAVISGITLPVPISVTGGEYSIGCGTTFTSAGGTVSNGQSICVRHTTAATGSTMLATMLTVGGVARSFSSTTGDVTPDIFSFPASTNVALSTAVVSVPSSINGITLPVPISVTGGEYSIGCGTTFTSAAGTVGNGQSVCVRHTTAATGLTMLTTTLMVGGVASSFSSTTGDVTPDAISFPATNNAAVSTSVTSASSNITGITLPVPISVTGGEYSIGCGTTFTSAAGTVGNGQSVCVRHTTAGLNSTTTTTTLTVGGVAGSFISTTVAAPPPPPPPTTPPPPAPRSGGGGGGSLDLFLLALLAGALIANARRGRRRP